METDLECHLLSVSDTLPDLHSQVIRVQPDCILLSFRKLRSGQTDAYYEGWSILAPYRNAFIVATNNYIRVVSDTRNHTSQIHLT